MNPTFHYTPSVDQLDTKLNNVIVEMGYTTQQIPAGYSAILQELYEQAREIVQPTCGFTVLPEGSAVVTPGKITLEGVEFKTDRIVAGPLKKMERAVLFAGTIGPAFDKWSKNTFDGGDPLAGFIIDLIGSELAENVAEWVHGKAGDYARENGLQFSNRYSPGYCGWSVAEQHQLFGFFPANFCGISLTESALMKPHKSVSGIIALGKEIKFKDYPCDMCKATHCYKNRTLYSTITVK
ncbi:hypothetical protein KC799_03330 [candidate division KSB1 bacterium]|nr:hypothetical protein [candidate division KSB1 bacterium]